MTALGSVGLAVGADHSLIDPPRSLDLDVLIDREQRLDPTSGAVAFRMTAESPDAPEETIHIDECDAPRRLTMRSARPDDHTLEWLWQVDLTEADGVTTLTFAQEVGDTTFAESVGPGWDYYLDRMVAAETGGDLGAIDFDDYFPAFAGHFRSELA